MKRHRAAEETIEYDVGHTVDPVMSAAAVRKRLRPELAVAQASDCSFWLTAADEVLLSIAAYLDMKTFALGVASSCRSFERLVNQDAFEGWLHEIRRLHRASPWVTKRPFEACVASDESLQARLFRGALKALDRHYVTTGWKLMPQKALLDTAARLPSFYGGNEDALVFCCRSCGSFVAPVDFLVGRGSMGHRRHAFILEPSTCMPFCCGVHEPAQQSLSSGTYILVHLTCPNKLCNTDLGWKYQDCVHDGAAVPRANWRKVGQYWVYAEAFRVVSPTGVFAESSGEEFFLSSDL